MDGVRQLVRQLDGADVLGAEGGELLNGFEDLVGEFAGRDEDQGRGRGVGVGLSCQLGIVW